MAARVFSWRSRSGSPVSLVPRTATDALCLAALAALCAYLLRKTLLQGGAMLGFDLFNYFFPGKVFAVEALRRGELPLWNPSVFFGVPFLANVQMAVLYPPNVLFLLLEFPRAVALSQWLHLVAGGAGMYALCRWVWRLSAVPALIGAIAFAGSGFFAAHMGHLNQVHAGVWLPWVALCQFRLAHALGVSWGAGGRSPLQAWVRRAFAPSAPVRWFVAGGVVVALQLTAGHTQEVYYTLFSLGLLAAGFTALPPAWAPVRWMHLPALAAIVANGALLAAAQLVPTLELSGLSYRQGGVPLEEAVGFGIERTYMLESLLPAFYSMPNQEVIGYVGVTALALALGAVASPARRTVLALASLALLAIALAVAAYTPLFPLLHAWIPMFGSFRAPGRWLLVSTFALAGLAAFGADALRYRLAAVQREAAASSYALAVVAAAGGLLFFAWRSQEVHAIHWLPHARVAVLWLIAGLGATGLALAGVFTRAAWPGVVLAAGLALELTYAAREMEYNRPGAAELYREQPAIARYLHSLSRSGTAVPDRTLSLAVEERLEGERLRRAIPEGGEYRRYAAMREVVRPNLGVVYGLPSIDGYDGGLLPLRDFALFKQLLVTHEPPVAHLTLAAQPPDQPNAALLGALNVRYLLTDGRSGSPGAGWTARDDAPGAAWLHEHRAPGPRAFVVDTITAEPVPARALALLRTLDWRSAAVVERPSPGLQTGPASAASGSAAPAGSATITSYAAQSVEIDVTATRPGLLVLTDTHYPGWKATVDGADAPVLRANVLFRGVAVAAGTHRVRFWYDPLSVKLGFSLSALALALNSALLWSVSGSRGQARAPRPPGPPLRSNTAAEERMA